MRSQKAALIALEDDALAGPHAMAITYRRNRSLIREIAERKYQAGQFESCGSVVIRLVDIADRLEGPTRPPPIPIVELARVVPVIANPAA